ncbi:MAG: hypothetical protein N4A46_05130, partial [Schleiferiaceae bacterium]|nr:hypothetical protein [Schleiferiaceae bacterium]
MRKSLRISLFSLSAVGLTAMLTQLNMGQSEAQYEPRNYDAKTSMGGFEYVNSMRVNQITGKIDPKDVAAAQNQASNMMNKTSALDLNWSSLGPDNMAGRARSFIIDKDNPNVMYIGGVSGGIFKSTSGGSSWVPMNETGNQNVTSIAEGADGTIYYGTGEGIHTYGNGIRLNGAYGFMGGGVFKSTDEGATWSVIQNTVPAAQSAGAEWAQVSKIITHPSEPNTIWVGTNKGLRLTTDGGANWSNPINVAGSNVTVTDMERASTGALWVSLNGRMMRSLDGKTNFVEMSVNGAGPGELPRSQGRVRLETSADGTYAYACLVQNNGLLDRVFKTTNANDPNPTWTMIGQHTASFEPFNQFVVGFSGNSGQGNFDLALGVDPHDKDRLILGGIDVWEYTSTGGWSLLSQWFVGNQNPPIPWYVHADQHDVVFDENNPNVFYMVNDGGLYKTSDNGVSWVEVVKELNTIQFYSISIGSDRAVMGGTQDNGTLLNDGTGNTMRTAVEVNGGDGGYNAISWLNKNVYFAYTPVTNLLRTENQGDSWERPDEWVSSEMQTAPGIWAMPFQLHETTNDPNSADSVGFVAYPALRSLGFGDGTQDSFYNTLGRPQESATFITDKFRILAGGDTIVSDAQGNLSGDGTGMFDSNTGLFYVVFDNAPVAEIIVLCDVKYDAGSELVLSSNINQLPYRYTLTSEVNPYDSIRVQDPVQAFYVAGYANAIYMTRDPLDFTETPEWWKIANIPGQSAFSIDISADGDVIYVGTATGRIYTISNVSQARDVQSADVSQGNPVTQITSTIIANGRIVTSIGADPTDNNRAVATLSSYGNQNYVYYSTNAASASPSY